MPKEIKIPEIGPMTDEELERLIELQGSAKILAAYIKGCQHTTMKQRDDLRKAAGQAFMEDHDEIAKALRAQSKYANEDLLKENANLEEADKRVKELNQREADEVVRRHRLMVGKPAEVVDGEYPELAKALSEQGELHRVGEASQTSKALTEAIRADIAPVIHTGTPEHPAPVPPCGGEIPGERSPDTRIGPEDGHAAVMPAPSGASCG